MRGLCRQIEPTGPICLARCHRPGHEAPDPGIPSLLSPTPTAEPVDGSFPVVVTSYEILLADIRNFQKVSWKYLVVDEGHRLKNHNCRLIRELRTLRVDNKLLLTGAKGMVGWAA